MKTILSNFLADFPVTIDIPVAWGEMDALGHVNNAHYFRYFESVRIAYFNQMGLMDLIATMQIGPVVSETSCRYKIPVTFPDSLTLGARIDEIRDDRFCMEYQIYSHQHQKITTLGKATIVMFDFKNKAKASLTEQIKQNIQQLENKNKH